MFVNLDQIWFSLLSHLSSLPIKVLQHPNFGIAALKVDSRENRAVNSKTDCLSTCLSSSNRTAYLGTTNALF